MSCAGRSIDIDVIIVHYHAADLVRQAVAALNRDAEASGLTNRILVADNGSTEAERALLQSLDIVYLPADRNLGYAGGIGFAFPYTNAGTIVLMNEDVLVLPGCLGSLRDALSSGAAVAGPEFYWDLDLALRLPCTEERTTRNEFLKAAGRRDLRALRRARECWRDHARRHWRATSPMTTTSISGALLAFRRETWQVAGPFGHGYQMYFDENDWLFRIERAGLRSVYVPQGKAIHLHNPKLAGNADRAQWSSDSFMKFGRQYYGDHFMNRLCRLGERPAAMPAWPEIVEADGAPLEIEIPSTSAWPVWIEFTPSPFGYPAATALISDRSTKRWRFPRLAGLPFMTGTFFLQVVDDGGRELGGYRFDHTAAAATQQPSQYQEALA